jgi:hypothetical protein
MPNYLLINFHYFEQYNKVQLHCIFTLASSLCNELPSLNFFAHYLKLCNPVNVNNIQKHATVFVQPTFVMDGLTDNISVTIGDNRLPSAIAMVGKKSRIQLIDEQCIA